MVAGSARTSRSRPRFCLVTSPAPSSTATCFCTAANDIAYEAARPLTEVSPIRVRRRMSLRVASASAWKMRSTSASSISISTTIWLYVTSRRPACQSRYMTSVPTLSFNDGHTIPQLGFGVYRVDPAETERIVGDALEVGYRHIDTASLYGNEHGVGVAIERSGIPRDELFITTKLWNSDQGEQAALDAIDLSLEKLGLDHVDLYLIHWPAPSRNLFVETWKTFEAIRDAGKATSIGVSNFRIQDLDRLAAETSTVPVINQIELHPLLSQVPLRDY